MSQKIGMNINDIDCKGIDIEKLSLYRREVLELRREGNSYRKIQGIFPELSGNSIANFLREHGVHGKEVIIARSRNSSPIASTIFDDLSLQWNAYWFGMFISDGCISGSKSLGSGGPTRRVAIDCGRLDKEHLQKLADHCGQELRYRSDRPEAVQWSINNYYLFERLRSLGVPFRKSLKPELADVLDHIPQSNMRHFLRGLFDGDGSIFMAGSGREVFELSGNYWVLQRVQKILYQELGIRNNDLQPDKEASEGFAKTRWRHSLDTQKIAGYLYQGANVYLERKQVVACNLKAKRPNMSSAFRGVGFTKKKQKWTVKVQPEGKYGKTCLLGNFDSELEAATCWDQWALDVWGEDAPSNCRGLKWI
jgi:intein-encoded DNA endonuclease-like protein